MGAFIAISIPSSARLKAIATTHAKDPQIIAAGTIANQSFQVGHFSKRCESHRIGTPTMKKKETLKIAPMAHP